MTETTTRAPQEKVCGYEYTVRRGDSFYLIAHRLGVPLRDLLEANASINPARLMVGDVLCIPMEEDDAPAPETQIPAEPAPLPETAPEIVIGEEIAGEIYPEADEGSLDMPAAEPVKTPPEPDCPGTDYTVAEGETAADIQLDRGLSFNTLQRANPTLSIDDLSPGDVVRIPAENIPCASAATYAIQPGEGLESVALKLNVSLGALLRANPCLAPADFVEGVRVAVPE